MTNLMNGIVTGLAALVLASGCGASNASLKAEEAPWEEGVKDTGKGYEAISCGVYSDRYTAKEIADLKARADLIGFVAGKEVTATGNSARSEVSGTLFGAHVVGEQVLPDAKGYLVCVKMAVPYAGVESLPRGGQ